MWEFQLSRNFLPLSFPETNEYQWENPHWDERQPQEKHQEKEIGKDEQRQDNMEKKA